MVCMVQGRPKVCVLHELGPKRQLNIVLSAIHRQYVAWLNSESLEHGGVLVDNFPVQYDGIPFTAFIQSLTIASSGTARYSPTTPTKNGYRFAQCLLA